MMGILGLQDQKLGKENVEEKPLARGELFPAVSGMDTVTCVLKFSRIFSLHLELARLPPLHRKIAVAVGWTGYVEVP